MVRFQPTPNPNAGKFITGRELVPDDRPRSYFSAEEASGEPLASALMALDGVASIFMVEDFVTVTKTPDADWDTLIPRVEQAIKENL
jgi:hypothetical protein